MSEKNDALFMLITEKTKQGRLLWRATADEGTFTAQLEADLTLRFGVISAHSKRCFLNIEKGEETAVRIMTKINCAVVAYVTVKQSLKYLRSELADAIHLLKTL